MRFTYNHSGAVVVYTDGACPNNGYPNAKAGIGVFWGDNHPLNQSVGVSGRQTNNVAEIQAARVAVDLALRHGIHSLEINTDSQFVVNAMTNWIYTWLENGWRLANGDRVRNSDEFMALFKAAQKIDIDWQSVRGHSRLYGNEMADALARKGVNSHRTYF